MPDLTRATLIDELSRFVCDPRAGETVTLTLDRDGAWELSLIHI